jgi:hypothetical protein
LVLELGLLYLLVEPLSLQGLFSLVLSEDFLLLKVSFSLLVPLLGALLF